LVGTRCEVPAIEGFDTVHSIWAEARTEWSFGPRSKSIIRDAELVKCNSNTWCSNKMPQPVCALRSEYLSDLDTDINPSLCKDYFFSFPYPSPDPSGPPHNPDLHIRIHATTSRNAHTELHHQATWEPAKSTVINDVGPRDVRIGLKR